MAIDASLDKATRVVELFASGKDGREIAKTLKFADVKEMSAYMAGHNYLWSQKDGNYLQEGQKEKVKTKKVPVIPRNKAQENSGGETVGDGGISRYLPFLQYLMAHQPEITILLESVGTGRENLPRYSLSGSCLTKSVHMSVGLDKLIRDYSEERSISQRDIIEIAMVEFFRKYGFEREVEMLLKS